MIQNQTIPHRWRTVGTGLSVVLTALIGTVFAQSAPEDNTPIAATTSTTRTVSSSSRSTSSSSSGFPSYSSVLKDYQKIVSTADGKKSLYTLYTNSKTGQMYAELPSSFASKRYFIAMTVASGDAYAGLQAGDMYFYWKRYDKRLALMLPNIDMRSTGDGESKSSVQRLFTDRVLVDVPIVTIGPGGGPVIDMDALLIGKASVFFGRGFRGSPSTRIQSITKAKAFPGNVEIAFEVPGYAGRLQALHYSISEIPSSTSYKPRLADHRVGYFTTSYSDLGKYEAKKTRVRYINRWQLEKADPKLKVSPPKNPIVFYIEHTTPIRYRRWVRKGVLVWNKAFERIGISNAIEVYYQDKASGSHMDKDPEDVRYNFVRWLNNNSGTAIGPSRVNPMTGQILDADIILTDGWIRYYNFQFQDLLPQIAMEGYSPSTIAWLGLHPDWDPRVRYAPPAKREFLKAIYRQQAMQIYGGHPIGKTNSDVIGDDEYDGLIGRTSQVNGLCTAAAHKGFDLTLMRMSLPLMMEMGEFAAGASDSMIDGMPEGFVGPMLAELVAHEVGHTIGLRHNFKASGIHKIKDINSEKFKGNKSFGGSVMDYVPININMDKEAKQGDFSMIGIGPYDYWAIEYGYTLESDLKPILSRVAEPELAYGTDEDTWGPDPLARRYDLGADPLEFAMNQVRLAEYHRKHLLDKYVKDGDSWSKARRGYELTLALQLQSISMMTNWIGGVHVYRDKKGDKNGRAPLEVVDAKIQRDAMKFAIEHSFRDAAYGLTTEMLKRMTKDKWLDGSMWAALSDATWPIHDNILSTQASTLTMLMNPTTLQRVYDNEFRIEADEDALTLPELLDTIGESIWDELTKDVAEGKRYNIRKPLISSLRRNLQREHLKRLIDLTMPDSGHMAAHRPISNISLMQLRQLRNDVTKFLENNGKRIDPYSRAHLIEVSAQIRKAMNAEYIYNAGDIGGRSSGFLFFHNQKEESDN